MNSEISIYIDTPDNYACGKFKFYENGCSPKLLEKLLAFLNQPDIVEVNAALYLFNNKRLHETFTQLGERGVSVNVISIPLDGYDSQNPKPLVNRETCKPVADAVSKHDLAKAIYDDVLKRGSYALHLFEHVYVRSAHREFARGAFPYSLHTKSFLLKYGDGTSVSILTSSNLAVRDLVKEELMVAIVHKQRDDAVKAFFDDLRSLSKPLQTSLDRSEPVTTVPDKSVQQTLASSHFFTAPFYYGSPELVEAYLFELIAAAKKEVYICAQHICALDYDYDASQKSEQRPKGRSVKPGFLAALRKLNRKTVKVRCLSQTYAEKGRYFEGLRKPANPRQFQRFSKAFRDEGLGAYAVNENIHAKFIVVDDKAVVTTCNFTPTQFMHLPFASMKVQGKQQRCIFGEVGHWIVLEGKAVQTLKRYFSYLWEKHETRLVIPS